MLGSGHSTLLVLETIFIGLIVNVFSQNIELSVKIDTKEEQQIIENLNTEDSLANSESPEEQLNEEVVSDEHQIPNVISEEHLNVADKNKQKQEKKRDNSSSLEFIDEPEEKDEPGFDLTSEEIKKFKIWKDGVIPYYIDAVSFSDKVFRDKIRRYLQMVNSATSLNFVELPIPPTNDSERWVFFMNRRGLLGCADHTVKNFTNQGVQKVVLGYDCMVTKGELAEAVMSIVGVPAQHNAPNRDKYINVHTENIMPDKLYLFEKLDNDDWLFHGLPYDFESITHYDIHKYSANGRVTLGCKKKNKEFNPAKEFSTTDLLKIKMLYNYITRNKKLQIPMCKKLFKPRVGFSISNYSSTTHAGAQESSEQTKEHDALIKQGEKVIDDRDKNNDERDEGGDSEKGIEKHNEENGKDLNENDNRLNKEEDIENKDENDGEIADSLQSGQDEQSVKMNEKNKKLSHKTLTLERNTELLEILSDYDFSDDKHKLSYKRPNRLDIDLISLLSDYQTDFEYNRKIRLQNKKRKL